ncbi:MAG: cytochrome c biogenesis protein CcsA, partial [Phycisphaerales bacterium]|nr:cytochrome c biogenesis protein CcsA [Phycisphaerales bacterium]
MLSFGPTNPIAVRLVQNGSRRVRHLTIRAAYLGALVVVLLGIRDAFAHIEGWGIVGIAAMSILGGAMIGLGGFAMVCGAAKPAPGAFDASAFPVERTKSILDDFDLCHRVLLYTAFVALFVGIVLGAVWADYSWGRPWGWDP